MQAFLKYTNNMLRCIVAMWCTIFQAGIPGELLLAGCPLDFPSLFITRPVHPASHMLSSTISLLSSSKLPVCLNESPSVVYSLQSESSLCSICPNHLNTVKSFDLAALKVSDFKFKVFLPPFVLANSNHTIPTHE